MRSCTILSAKIAESPGAMLPDPCRSSLRGASHRSGRIFRQGYQRTLKTLKNLEKEKNLENLEKEKNLEKNLENVMDLENSQKPL